MNILSRAVWAFLVLFLAIGVSGGAGAAEKKEEKGVWIERKGSLLNLRIEENKFELHFLDEEKKPIEPDAVQAVVHYTSTIVRDRETLALLPVEGEEGEIYFTSPRFIRAPYQFQILLVLFFDEAGTKTEAHTITFQQPVRE